LVNPQEERSPANELAASERNGRYRRAAGHTTGHGLRDMGFRAVKQLGNLGECQQIKVG
jgi:hypothetical protein